MVNLKPIKIKLSNGTASGMYILINSDEIKYDKNGNTKAPSSRAYKIQIEVETIYNNKRVRGKRSYSIPKGTSVVKAVSSLLGKRTYMISTLKEKGTLKIQTSSPITVDNKTRIFYDCWHAYYTTRLSTKRIKQSTYNLYKKNFDVHLKPLHKKLIDNITINDVQNIINNMISKKKAPATIAGIKPTVKPILDFYDILLNWNKLSEPEINNERKYKRSKQDTIKIVNALQTYEHPQIRSIFAFSLTGRRISEIISLRYENINWNDNTYIILKENVKTTKELKFNLIPSLQYAIKSMGDIKLNGNIFSLKAKWVLIHFKRCLANLEIYDMTLHDIRAMVAQTALDSGAGIYEVSAMLAHSSVGTTEKRYVDKTKDHADKALINFTNAINTSKESISYNEDIEDAEIIENEFSSLQKIYPYATKAKIQKIINMMKK